MADTATLTVMPDPLFARATAGVLIAIGGVFATMAAVLIWGQGAIAAPAALTLAAALGLITLGLCVWHLSRNPAPLLTASPQGLTLRRTSILRRKAPMPLAWSEVAALHQILGRGSALRVEVSGATARAKGLLPPTYHPNLPDTLLHSQISLPGALMAMPILDVIAALIPIMATQGLALAPIKRQMGLSGRMSFQVIRANSG